ncbi:MAG TPA: NAD-binding protein [Chloroflexia bacterium]|jgi:Trk K+ transport system NAD-binding subunit
MSIDTTPGKLEENSPVPVAGQQVQGHIVLCGLDGLGLRTLEELHRLGEDVIVIAHEPSETFTLQARQLGATIVTGNQWEEPVLRQAGVTAARAIILTDKDDVANLHAGLVAQDLNPGIPVILHMFNMELGQQVKALFRNCAVLSSSEIAAPAFIAAALHPYWEQRLDVQGHTLVVRAAKARARLLDGYRASVPVASDPRVLFPLACIKGDGTATLFPDSEPSPDAKLPSIGEVCEDVVFLVDEGPTVQGAPHVEHERRQRFDFAGMLRTTRRLFLTADLRLRWLSGIILGLVVVSALIFSQFQGLNALDAIYFTISTITTTGFGDISLVNAHPALKLYGTLLMVLGTAALAIFYALITDVLVSARLAQVTGEDLTRRRDHVVVAGLGTIGFIVAQKLSQIGVPVVAIELNPNGRFVPGLRALGVPVVLADGRLPETLDAVGIRNARCLVTAIDGDIANLQTALTARSLNPNLRVVLRLFDPDLSTRMERTFQIHVSRSPAALAAPAMLAAAVGGQVIAPVQVADQVVFILRTTVEPGSRADGNTIDCLEESAEDEAGGMEGRVLLLVEEGNHSWRPPKGTVLRAGHELVLAVSQRGLGHILSLTNPGPLSDGRQSTATGTTGGRYLPQEGT